MKIRPLAIGSIVAITSIAIMTSAQANSVSARDFVRNASIINEFEVESGKLALEKSQNKEIKGFAQHVIDDDTKNGDRLAGILQSSNSQLQPAKGLDDKHQKLVDQLQAVSGDDFNHQYVKLQADAHKEEADLFASYSKHGEDPALKDYAAQTLPSLKDHLAHVKTLNLD